MLEFGPFKRAPPSRPSLALALSLSVRGRARARLPFLVETNSALRNCRGLLFRPGTSLVRPSEVAEVSLSLADELSYLHRYSFERLCAVLYSISSSLDR